MIAIVPAIRGVSEEVAVPVVRVNVETVHFCVGSCNLDPPRLGSEEIVKMCCRMRRVVRYGEVHCNIEGRTGKGVHLSNDMCLAGIEITFAKGWIEVFHRF